MKYLKLFILLFIFADASAQTTIVKQDPEIKKMVEEVSAKNVEATVRKLVSFETRHTLSDTLSKTTGIGAARNWIKSEFEKYSKESGGRLKVAFDTFVQPADGRRVPQDAVLKNVIATLPGTDPTDNRIFIVSGHYDSRASEANDATSKAPGAVDDASGTAVSMELARVMSKQKYSATIIFVAAVGEEQGLYGATHLAKKAKAEGWNVVAMITNDIVGNTYGAETNLKDNRSVRVFSEGVPVNETKQEAGLRIAVGGENDSPAREFARYVKEVSERYVDQLDVKLIYRRDRYLRGGDHTAFSQEGFAAVRFTEMNENFDRQHQNVRNENGRDFGDMPDFADYTYIQKVCRMNLSVLANIAKAPAEPQNVGIVTSDLTNNTTLKWQAPKSAKPAGYYILMRETTSPFWEKKIYVTDTTATIPYSKDNYFFAVQSVDVEGHESSIVFPKPVR
ncbi:MAG: M28 family peptidase [Bacteroidetes bacterium]|nr:M28 family peptidase [Bacteroidota bacterium]MBU1485356.1 M28 family peptidase [Bacteroidota bacterium]MBU1759492.1 M28 family peptidase [Bacteroidota bacterium]MBU2266576.1 M28 family peptidase [Bacteroidota bacterium]MBU2376935.1 M28 family peptidase [Bacteroidota bacterium]